ncbi:hypothetical protein [Salana multivorans]
MSTTDYSAWLGLGDTTIWPDGDPTPEQLDRFHAVAAVVEARWPDPDDQHERDAALFAALEVITGGESVTGIGHRAAAAQTALLEARAAQVGAALAARDAYPSEQALADALGVTRMTVRSWLGK